MRVVNRTTTSVLASGQQMGVESTEVLGPRCGSLKTNQVVLEPGLHLLTRTRRLIGKLTILQKIVSIKGDVLTMKEITTPSEHVVDKAAVLEATVDDLYDNMLK